mmetsp:Transcript_39233/g.122768  ORF Transcript_39233/g.122768 Transcript_39233/m.122768 type:complete len:338 (-) Transcript_39233:343-1356(-)
MMYLAKKVDWEDEMMLNKIRVMYYTLQTVCCVLFVGLSFVVRANKDDDRSKVIYTRPATPSFLPPQPYVRSTYAEHEASQVWAGLRSFAQGMCLTSVLHFKFGMNQALLLQSSFAPLTLYDNGIVRKYILGEKGRVWDEKFEEELTAEELAEAKTPDGQPVDPDAAAAVQASKASDASEKLDALMAKAWDDGEAAELVGALDSSTVNCRNKTERWSPLMVVCGLKGDFTSEIGALLKMGADVFVTDEEGWSCLHWAAFHGNATTVTYLTDSTARSGSYSVPKLVKAKDSEGKTPLRVAKDEVAKAKRENKKAIAAKLEEVVSVLENAEAGGSLNALE